MLDPPC